MPRKREKRAGGILCRPLFGKYGLAAARFFPAGRGLANKKAKTAENIRRPGFFVFAARRRIRTFLRRHMAS